MLLLLLAAAFWVVEASENTETIIYKKLGDDVDLKPKVPLVDKISSITWFIGGDIVAQWDGTEVDYYRFKGRGHLDNATGVMTIRGLEKGDSNDYTTEVNHNQEHRNKITRLIVISEVPVPAVVKACSEEPRQCTLTCEGNVSEAAPVTYTWRSDHEVLGVSERTFTVTEESSGTEAFTCELKNPVSQKSSEPFSNPFSSSPPTAPEEGLKVVSGLIVFVCLLTAALLPVIFHRLKTGVCFYEKTSMPWEKDFWTKEHADVVESNGAATRPPNEKCDEETPMTES
uniref:Ig-like domain-containing protein n=1 Tax=Iconisemion striatum TaxID=60296 RepID=A0A1A7XL00_9TELE